MATNQSQDSYSIIGIGVKGDEHIALVTSSTGISDHVFETIIGKCLRGDVNSLTDSEQAWMSTQLAAGATLNFTSLQTEIATADLEFFLVYWYEQFSTLVSYPYAIKKPSITSEAGLKAEARFRDN
jgi:hypothetical protein